MKQKVRSEINDNYKWDLTKIIKNDDDYENTIAEINIIVDKVLKMKTHIGDSSDNLYCFLENTAKFDELLTKIYVYSNLYFQVQIV